MSESLDSIPPKAQLDQAYRQLRGGTLATVAFATHAMPLFLACMDDVSTAKTWQATYDSLYAGDQSGNDQNEARLAIRGAVLKSPHPLAVQLNAFQTDVERQSMTANKWKNWQLIDDDLTSVNLDTGILHLRRALEQQEILVSRIAAITMRMVADPFNDARVRNFNAIPPETRENPQEYLSRHLFGKPNERGLIYCLTAEAFTQNAVTTRGAKLYEADAGLAVDLWRKVLFQPIADTMVDAPAVSQFRQDIFTRLAIREFAPAAVAISEFQRRFAPRGKSERAFYYGPNNPI